MRPRSLAARPRPPCVPCNGRPLCDAMIPLQAEVREAKANAALRERVHAEAVQAGHTPWVHAANPSNSPATPGMATLGPNCRGGHLMGRIERRERFPSQLAGHPAEHCHQGPGEGRGKAHGTGPGACAAVERDPAPLARCKAAPCPMAPSIDLHVRNTQTHQCRSAYV